MPRSRTCTLILLLSLTLVSCSRPKTITRDELGSDLLAAISISSETELFIHQLQEGRTTASFAESHMAYLVKQATQSADELRRAHADQAIVGALENGRAQLDSLTGLLTALKNKTRYKENLSSAAQQAAKIRMILEHTKDEL